MWYIFYHIFMRRTKKISKNEDIEDIKSLQKIAKAASDNALRIARAMGHTITIIRNHKVIEMYPNGEEKVIKQLDYTPLKIKGLKKGSVLCRKK